MRLADVPAIEITAGIDELRAAFATDPTAGVELAILLGDAFEDDALRDVVAELGRRLDREAAIRAYGMIARGLLDRYLGFYLAIPLRPAVAAARTDASPERWIDLAIELAGACAEDEDDDLDDDDDEPNEVDALIDELFERTRHDPALAVDVRRRLAAVFASHDAHDRAHTQLRAALEVAPTDEVGAVVAAELAEALMIADRGDDALDIVARWLTKALRVGPAPAIRLYLVRERLDADPLVPARAAAELARDLPATEELRAQAAYFVGERLVERGELAEAERWLVELGSEDFTPGVALLEDIGRRLGKLPEIATTPGDLADDDFVLAADVVAFFTPPGALVTSDKMRAWSYGHVATAADLENEKIFGPRRSYVCGCGRYRGNKYAGIVCERCRVELIDARSRRMRLGHFSLPTPVAHPWHLGTIAMLLGTSKAAVRATEGDELLDKLRYHLWLDDELHKLDAELADAWRPNRQQELRARRDAIAAFVASGTRPEALVLEVVPVLPPEAALGDRARVRAAYAKLFDGHPLHGVTALFDCFA